MFLDDTACNLASSEPAQVLRRRHRPLRRRFLPPRLPALDADPGNLRLHGPVPERLGRAEVVRLPHARPGLRQPGLAAHGAGHSLRFAGRPQPVRAPSPPSCTRRRYATSAEIAAEVGPFPRYDANREAMLRVVRNHRRAAYNAPQERVRGADHHAGRHRRALLPGLSARGRPPRVRPHGGAGREARLSQRPGHLHRADRHDRPGHGLRHHRRRTRLRPGEVQEAGRRRLLQDHQRLHPAGPRPARLHAEADRGHRPLLPRRRHAARLPAHQPRQPARQGLPRRRAPAHRGAAARRLRAAVRLQSLDGRRRRLHRASSASPRSRSRRRASTC